MRHVVLFFVSLLLISCAASPSGPVIDLSDLQPLPPASGWGNVVPLRVAVAAVISPKGTAESYQPLLDYLSLKLDRPVELVQRRTYLEVNDLIESGYVDAAFVCTSAYVAGHDQFGMELLAAPEVNGEIVYYSLLIVPADSPPQISWSSWPTPARRPITSQSSSRGWASERRQMGWTMIRRVSSD